jgi:hypothetical protein
MKRVLPFFFVASLLAVVASCVDSHNPASDKKTSKIDERLIGEWKAVAGNEVVWKVSKSKDVENALEVKMSDPKEHDRFLAFTTTIKSKSYLSMHTFRYTMDGEKPKPEDIRFDIYQYELSDKGTVQLRNMDPSVILKAIREKHLVGKIGKDEDDEEVPEITDTMEGIVRYLETHEDECYSESSKKFAMMFKRQK